MGSRTSRAPDEGSPHAHGDYLGERFWLERPRSHVTRSLQRGELAVTQIKSDFATPEPSQSIAYDEAYLIGLMVSDVPDHELWQDGVAMPTESFRAGHAALFDLRRDPVNFTRTPHHSLHFYIPRAALVELAERAGCRFDGELRYRFAAGYDDPVLRNLGSALLPALEAGGAVSGLFLDHILHAVASHVLGRYGETVALPERATRGGLTPPQLARAKEMMQAHLSGDISMTSLAEECGLSASHFARAFRQSTGTSPHGWLQQRRIERAKELLLRRETPLSEIAIDCGFGDQSHFTRTFGKYAGTSPARWRRLQR